MKPNVSRILCTAALLASIAACSGSADESGGVSATNGALTVGGYPCPQTGTIAVSTIPANSQYYLTTFTGGTMSCGEQADGVSLYIADRQRFGCGTHVRVTNPANGKSCVTFVGDTGPNICVEEAADEPIIDASPAISEYLFNESSEGWSGHRLVTAQITTDAIGCGAAPVCGSDSDCNHGATGTQKVCGNGGQCITGCHENSDCPSSDYCDITLATWACEPTPVSSGGGSGGGAGGGGGSGACTEDSQCNGGRTGTQEVCGDDGTCIRGCHSDSDCPSNDYCDTSLITWECSASESNGGGSGGGSGAGGGSGGGSSSSCSVCTCDDDTCAMDSRGDCDDGSNCRGLTNYCSTVCTCDDNSCPTSSSGTCADGSNCLTGDQSCGNYCTCDDNSCATNSAGDCSDGYNCQYGDYCNVCICGDNSCAVDSDGDCDDGSNCFETSSCSVCTCDDNSCGDENGDCGDGYNCLYNDYCDVCACSDDTCAIDSDGDCDDGSNCFYGDKHPPKHAHGKKNAKHSVLHRAR